METDQYGWGLGIYHRIYFYMKKNKEKKQKKEKIKYKGKCIKMHDDTWEQLKKERKKSGLSWNMYLSKLMEK